MAGHARYTAVLDACVLYPVSVADALISLAVGGLFAAKWTTSIEDEWTRHLERNRPELRGRLAARRNDMRAAVSTNLKDFPADVLRPYGIEAVHPDEFLIAQLDLDEFTALAAFRDMRARKRNPVLDAEAFAHASERNGLVATANRLRLAAALI